MHAQEALSSYMLDFNLNFGIWFMTYRSQRQKKRNNDTLKLEKT